MKKWFGKNKTAHAGSGPSKEAPIPSRSPEFSPKKVLSVRPEYLDLANFSFPETARSVIATKLKEEIVLERCRRCSDGFVHTFMDWTTNIIFGIPRSEEYTAISYVWGETIQLPMTCSRCGYSFHIPMQSAYRFRRLMMTTANSGDTVWLDALSIDQTDMAEKEKVLAVMGDIYSRAKTVAVLFPSTDGDGFKTVYDLAQAATAINSNKLAFSQAKQGGDGSSFVELSKVCQQFYDMLSQLNQDLRDYVYWRRAWTFQEWALARQISITWEGGLPANMASVKTTILNAATLTSIYAFSQGAYAQIKVGFPQAHVPGRFEMVRKLFPDEQAFDPPGMVDEEEVSFDMMMPSLSFGHALGLRAWTGKPFHPVYHEMYTLRSDLPESEPERFRHRLCVALHALGASEREARSKADQVHSWASMCNIKYPYDTNDSYVVALQKVLHSLRTEHKIKVYNFLVNTSGASGEVDANFAEYSRAHQQCNATVVKGDFGGIPIFNGRADTAIHLRLALAKPTTLPRLQGSGVELRKIKNAYHVSTTPMTERNEVLSIFAMATSGTADGVVFQTVLHNVSEILESTPPDQLSRSSLASVVIDFSDPGEKGEKRRLMVWAIIPRDLDHRLCFVARESLNGTLVLAMPGSSNPEVLAYLTLTDHQCGTLLVTVHAHAADCRCGMDHGTGRIDMRLKPPVRRGVMNSAVIDERLLQANIRLETESSLAY